MICKFFHKLKLKMSTKNDNIEQEDLKKNENTETAQNESTAKGTQEEIVEEEEELDEFGLLNRENEQLKTDLGESKNKFIRLFAEFDNFKKRSAKERSETIQTASKKAIISFLPVMDDFERALKTNIAEDEADHNEGFTLIYQKLKRVLEGHGVVAMNSQGTDFDSDLHDAITKIEAGEEMKGKIVDVVEEGYYMNDIIIRHAKVVVGS